MMYLKFFAINALKYMTLIQFTFYQQQGWGGGMFQRLHVKGFEWKKICQNLMNETSRSSLSFPFADLLSLFV